MYCYSCGQPAEGTVKFCSRCGVKSSSVSVPATSDSVPATYANFWVFVSIAILFFRPLGLFAQFEEYQHWARQWTLPRDLELIIGVEMLVRLVFCIWGTVIALQLLSRKPSCLVKLRTLLRANLCYIGVDILVATVMVHGDVEFIAIARSVTFLIPCYFYFKMSKTVHEVYGANL